MLIRHLRFFVSLAEEQHFGRAADKCNVTQPTLSQAIRKLENDLNAILIVRGHRFSALTTEGERVLHWGRQILADYDSLQGALGGNVKGLIGTLRLGVIPAAMPSVAFLSEQFETRHPSARIDIRSMTSRAIAMSLENFELDGGITYLDNEPIEHLRTLPLYHERYVFACKADHELARNATVTWQEAAKQPLCLLSDDMQNRRILNAVAQSVGVSIEPRVVSNSFFGVASHLRNGRWCAIVPHSFAFVFGGTADLALREMTSPSHQQRIGLVLLDRMPQSPMAAALEACADGVEFERRFNIALNKRDLPA